MTNQWPISLFIEYFQLNCIQIMFKRILPLFYALLQNKHLQKCFLMEWIWLYRPNQKKGGMRIRCFFATKQTAAIKGVFFSICVMQRNYELFKSFQFYYRVKILLNFNWLILWCIKYYAQVAHCSLYVVHSVYQLKRSACK